MQTPVPFVDKLALEDGFVMHPEVAVQPSSNQLTMLMRNGEYAKLVTLQID